MTCDARNPPAPRRLRVLQGELDRCVDIQNARVAELGTPTRCRPGCDSCCYGWVDALPEEASAILEAVRERDGAGGVAALVTAAKEHVAAAKSAGCTTTAWFALKRPCLFLREGRCSVYRERPFTCRIYHVTSDPSCCSPDRPGHPVTRINHIPAARAYLDYFDAPTDFLPALIVAVAEGRAPWT